MAYTALDLTAAVKDDLKDPSFSATRILRYLNYGQLAIFNTHSFKFCETSISGALTVGEYTYEQQDDHQSTIGGSVIDEDNTSIRWHFDSENYLPHREFFDQFPNPSLETSQMPRYWTEFGDQIYFSCPVNDDYTFTQRYYRVPTELVDDTDVPDVPESFRELLELYALYRSEKYRGNHDVAATYKQDFEDGLESMSLRYSDVTSMGTTIMRGVRTRVDA